MAGAEEVAKEGAHDNYSAILIRICEDQPEDLTAPRLFKLNRRPKGSDNKFENFEFFRTRKEATARLMELSNYGPEKELYQYGLTRISGL